VVGPVELGIYKLHLSVVVSECRWVGMQASLSLPSDLRNRVNTHRMHLSQIDEQIAAITNIAEALEQNERSDKVENQREAIISHLKDAQNINDRITVLNRVIEGSLTAPEGQLAEKVKEECEKLLDKRSDTFYKTLPKFKEFERRIWLISHPDEMYEEDDEEGLMMVATQKTVKCTLTKEYFEDPVKNSRCGHVFEKEAILSIIAKPRYGGPHKCPTPGCGRPIGRDTLVPDPETKRAVVEAKQEEREMASQRQLDEDVVDL